MLLFSEISDRLNKLDSTFDLDLDLVVNTHVHDYLSRVTPHLAKDFKSQFRCSPFFIDITLEELVTNFKLTQNKDESNKSWSPDRLRSHIGSENSDEN